VISSPNGPPITKQRSRPLPPLLEEAAEADRVELLAVAVQQRHERPLGHPSRDLLVLANLHQLEPRVAREQLLVVLRRRRRTGGAAAHGDDDDPHDGILRARDGRPNPPERHINIHFSPR
jgi:hypothetical protein